MRGIASQNFHGSTLNSKSFPILATMSTRIIKSVFKVWQTFILHKFIQREYVIIGPGPIDLGGKLCMIKIIRMIKIIYTSSVEFYNILLNKHCNRYYLRCILRIEHISLYAIRREWDTVVLIHIRKSLSLEILVPFLKFALFTTLKWNVWLLVWWNIKTSNDPQSVFIFWLFLWLNG